MTRRLIGSDLIIVLAIIMHLWESVVFATTRSADGAIGMAALLVVFHWHWLAAFALAAAATAAVFGQWLPNLTPHKRLMLLIGQQTLMLITALAATYAILRGAYADGVVRSFQFISCDQFPRIGAAVAYTAAIIARVRP